MVFKTTCFNHSHIPPYSTFPGFLHDPLAGWPTAGLGVAGSVTVSRFKPPNRVAQVLRADDSIATVDCLNWRRAWSKRPRRLSLAAAVPPVRICACGGRGTRRDWGEQQKRPWIRLPRVAAGEDEFVIFVESFKDVC